MKMHALLITSGLLFVITGAAKADDHLFQATNNTHTHTHRPALPSKAPDLSMATAGKARAVHSRVNTPGHPQVTLVPTTHHIQAPAVTQPQQAGTTSSGVRS
jgi:hypothetical protein